MAFEGLSAKLQEVTRKLRGKARITESDLKEMLREVKLALLEADVNYAIVKEFINTIQEKALGQDVLKSLTPGQQVIKIVKDELVELLGGTESKINFTPNPPTVIMLVGLQGSGKTTTAGKIANLLRKQGKKPLLVACDVYRPAAIKQLQVVGGQLNIPVYANESSKDLDNNTNEIKDIVNDLKNVPLSKNNYILKQEDKDKLVEYLDKVDKTNNDYKTIQDLSVSLKDISTELSESKETIKILKESNNALELRNTNLKNDNSKLKEKNKTLQNELDSIKELFEKIKNKLNDLYHFFVDKMWGDKEKRDKYYPVAYELYGKNILDEEQLRDILGTKQRSAEIDRESKSRDDDFEL